MHKSKTVTVNEGRVLGYGLTKTEAKADLKNAIARWCAADEPHMETRFGWLLIAYQMPTGDCAYRVIGPDHLIEHGKTLHASCICNGTLAEVIDSARYSIAQNAWNRAGSDETHIAEAGLKAERAAELRRWIAWQRSYDTHRAAGKSHNEAFNLASGRAA